MVAGAAATVDRLADTGPGATFTVAVWVIAVPLIFAEMVFASATVDASVPVATPLASVGANGCVSVFPVPVAASCTVAPLTGWPFASFAVTVIVDVALPAASDVGSAVTVDSDADTPPPPPLPAPALISTPSAPALLPDQVASIVLSFTAHSANRSPVVPSPEGCSSIRVKPLPAVAAGVALAMPNTPYPTSLAFAKVASVTVNPLTVVPLVAPVCTTAPAPFVPLASTPSHCDTIHWQLDTVTLDVIVIGPLPGAALMARKMVTRSRGVAPLNVVVATTSQAVMPPPVSVGAGAALED